MFQRTNAIIAGIGALKLHSKDKDIIIKDNQNR